MAKKASSSVLRDVAVARRALGLVVGLSGGAHNVAYALLEHYNRATGQCDPSVARLATMLGLSVATVKRATNELCQEYSLFEKSSHGGNSHRAKYVPNWEKLRAVADDWDARMASGAAPRAIETEASTEETEDLFTASKVSKVSPSRAQSCDLDGINIEPRTYYNKPIGINPCTNGASGEGVADTGNAAGSSPSDAPSDDMLAGLWKGNEPPAPYTQSQVAPSGRAAIAHQVAMKRLDAAMRRHGQTVHARFLEWVTADVSNEAASAEMRRRGDGERFILDRMIGAGLSIR